ncbi:MAG: protease modulator HflC [Polyangia bacterium]
MTRKVKSWISVAVVLLLALIVVNSALYTVGEAEQIVIVRFGEVIGDAVTEPGLHVKTPFIDEARRFERRWLEWDGDPSQTTTLDKRYISIDIFARWRIDDPLVFIEKLRDENSAMGRLDDIIDNAIRNVIANHALIEAVRSSNRKFLETDEEARASGESASDEEATQDDAQDQDPGERDQAAEEEAAESPQEEGAEGGSDIEAGEDSDAGTAGADAGLPALADAGLGEKPPPRDLPPPSELTRQRDIEKTSDLAVGEAKIPAIEAGRDELTDLILEKASPKAAELGIDLKDVRIKRIGYIESVRVKVFDRMISERQRVAEAFRSQGRGLSAEILGRKEKELKKIRSGAYRRAEEIRGRADAKAARIYAEAYNVDPEFYEFVKTLESYGQTFDEETWLLMTTESDYARRIRRMSGGGR